MIGPSSGSGAEPQPKIFLCGSVTLCEITSTREIVLVCIVNYVYYTIYTAQINPCVTVAEYQTPRNLVYFAPCEKMPKVK